MRFSICIEMFYPNLGFVERLYLIQAAGFDTVEFWSPYDKDLPALHQKATQLGLSVANFSGHRNYSPVIHHDLEGFLKEIEQNVKAAKALGCRQLMVLSDALQGDGSAKPCHLSPSQKQQNLIKALAGAVEIAKVEEVELCLEPLNLNDHPGYFLHQSQATFETIRTIDSPYLNVLFDIYHLQRSEGHILETIKENIGKIAYFHVADVPGRVEPGSGELNYANIFRAIKDLGFTGTVGFECQPQHDETEALNNIQTLIEPFAH